VKFSFLAEKLPYSQICGTKVSTSYKKRPHSNEQLDYTNWGPEQPDVSTKCVFPFKFRDEEHNECITKGLPGQLVGPWCSQDYEYRGRFYACDDGVTKYSECTEMSKETGKWIFPNSDENARGCFTSSNYICEMMKEGEERPIIPSDPPKQDPCNESKGWYGYEGSKNCYKFDFEDQTDVEPIGWEEAHTSCINYGADMVSLHKFKTELKIISRNCDQNLNIRQVFITKFRF